MQYGYVNLMPSGLRALVVIFCLALLGACTSIPVEERDARRAEINRDAEETIALLMEQDPEFAEALEMSAGYMTSRISSATVAVVGGARGIGVLVNKQSGDRTYVNFKRTDLGAGLGLTKFRFLVLAEDAEALENIPSQKYLSSLTAAMSAGEKGSRGGYNSAGYRVFTVSESGASVAATARLTKVSVNNDLTDTGISEVSIPNIGFETADGLEPVKQRTWDHKLPFMAQKVIDLGYDLPLPYGLKVLYSDIEQDQILEELQVGFSGGEKEPFEWVAFENAISFSETYQAIGDAWVLPFLNVSRDDRAADWRINRNSVEDFFGPVELIDLG